MKPQTIVLMGRSGCGKGTQADLLKKYFADQNPERHVVYVETGMRFREFIKGETYTHALSKQTYEKNERQPDFLAVLNWASMFVETMQADNHLIIDGTPRSLPEALALDSAFRFYDRTALVVHLNISRETGEKRLLARGRSDDRNAESNKRRFEWFDKDVVPALEHFKSLSNTGACRFLEVDAEQPLEDVHRAIVSALS
jgi:adenylate kinase family enzyme